MKRIALALLLSSVGHYVAAEVLVSSIDPSTVPVFKTTENDRYLSSLDAYNLLLEEPEVLFIDVRDPVEISMSGHPSLIDAIVPVRILQAGSDGLPDHTELAANPEFLETMEFVLRDNNKSRHDLIVLTCGSGRRSAEAARILTAAGFTNVWHIPDGYDGDHLGGFNTDNAWRAAGLPWSMSGAPGGEWRLLIE